MKCEMKCYRDKYMNLLEEQLRSQRRTIKSQRQTIKSQRQTTKSQRQTIG